LIHYLNLLAERIGNAGNVAPPVHTVGVE
jgi:hypothetical protein